jgi:general stress protein YciG
MLDGTFRVVARSDRRQPPPYAESHETSRGPSDTPVTSGTPPLPDENTTHGIANNSTNSLNGGRTVNTAEHKERRGFASMSPEKQREIASKGGRAAHEKGTAHEWTADEARSAGRKGGQVSRGGRGRLIEPSVPPSEHQYPPRPEAGE